MKCPNCNADLADGLKFCTKCGMPLSTAAPSYTSPGSGMSDLSPVQPSVRSSSKGLIIAVAVLAVVVIGGIVFAVTSIKKSDAALAAKEEELAAAVAEAEEQEKLAGEAEAKLAAMDETSTAEEDTAEVPVEEDAAAAPEEAVDEIVNNITSTSASSEDFLVVMNPTDFVNYKSSVGSGYFSIYYPLGLYQTASHEYDLGGDLYGDLLEKVTFFGANGSYLIYYNYKRTDGDSMEAKGDFISSSEGSHLVEATVQTPKCPDGMKKYAIYGQDGDIASLSVYELVSIDSDYVCIMKIGNNTATGSNAEKYSDWSLTSYYNECLYRMAGFCRYDGTYREYDEFYEVAKEW